MGRGIWNGLTVQAESDGRGAGTSAGNGDVNGDEAINLTDAVYLLEWLFRGGPAPDPIECPPPGGGVLPATGQSKCYGFVEGRGWSEVPCDSAACAGQDGADETGCPTEGRFTDNGDGTVTDTCTGLQWQKDTADTNGDGHVVDDGIDSLAWCDALAYCENLSFAGHDDWRLPNVRELQSIVDYGRESPSISPVFSSLSSMYWSSTSRVLIPPLAFHVTFDVGALLNSGKGEEGHVRAVRHAQ